MLLTCRRCDAEDVVSAARFTRSGVLAAPVLVCQQRARLDAIRVVAANSGNANAATGNRGLDEAARMQGAAAMAGRVEPDQVAVCSTGVPAGARLPYQRAASTPLSPSSAIVGKGPRSVESSGITSASTPAFAPPSSTPWRR